MIASMAPKLGVVTTSYSHNEPLIGNRMLNKGTVAIFGSVHIGGPFKKISGLIDKMTGKKDSVGGRS